MNEETLFAEAIAIESPEKRSQFLDEACGDNLKLRKSVEQLLHLANNLDSFLEHPPFEAVADALKGIEPTFVYGDGSTHDDEGEANSSGQFDMRDSPQAPDDKISLDFLEPATREDSLGHLGHYEIFEVIGRGAFGTVLRAFDEKLQRVVAVKVLAPEMAATSPARKRFLREARTSAKIRHENVVTIHAVEDAPIPYLVMEYIPGKTLQRRLDEQGPLELPDVLRLGKQIADGLAAAHAEGLIHRDIKPGNILLEGGMDERVRITDFGLARTADDASMTHSGLIAGTPMYMAPEQAQGVKLDQRADLFSFGSVLYQMLSGRPPFRAPTTMAVLKRVTEDTPRPLQEVIPEMPEWMCELIGHLHAKNPDERYGSAREVSELLAQCADDLKAGHVPQIPNPSKSAEDSPADLSEIGPRRSEPFLQSPLVKLAAALVIMLGVFGITEATGVTRFASTVIRLTTGSGTLVIESDDPGVKIAINGEEVTITGGGVEELTLRPGEYKIAALKDGQPVKQELVSITRNGKTVVRMSLEPNISTTKPEVSQTGQGAEGSPWPKDAPPMAIAPFDGEQAQRHQQAWADYLDVPVQTANDVGMNLRLIPPGRFLMRQGYDVTISKPFRIGTCEVTIAQFRAFVEGTGYKTSAEILGGYHMLHESGRVTPDMKHADFTWRHEDVNRGDDYPAAQLSWEDAVKFCEWLSGKEGKRYRLPTEAEWEWAGRAGKLTTYHFGNDHRKLSDYAWYKDNAGRHTHRVGLMKPNAWGLFDVHGNVFEYCHDWYNDLPDAQVSDPAGPTTGEFKVVRGGGWVNKPEKSGFYNRFFFAPAFSVNHFGFRIVCELDEPDAAKKAAFR